jgi:uncharacterized protein (DUF58 family)
MATLSLLPHNRLKQRLQAWIEKRNPLTAGTVTLSNRRLYILPTRFGYIYALMLFILLLAAINYQNSMAYAMTFLLTALGIISLWQTHNNLLGLEVSLSSPAPAFAGDHLTLAYQLRNPAKPVRYAVGIQYENQPPGYIRVDGQGTGELKLKLATTQRGRYKAAAVTIFTRYPTGLFHAWGLLRFDRDILVYPKPDFDARLEPSLLEAYDGQATVDTTDGDDFAGLREHRMGESLRHISWKAYAQGRGMLTKTFQGHAAPSLNIRWQDMSAPSPEGKLSQMTAMVVQAHQSGRKYAITLPTIDIELDDGPAHYAHCLGQLATFQQPESSRVFHASHD